MMMSRIWKKDFLGKGFVKKSAMLSTVVTTLTIIEEGVYEHRLGRLLA